MRLFRTIARGQKMKFNDDYCVFILCYNRPDMVYTLNALEDANYKGNYLLVLGDDDPKFDEYVERYGENHIVSFSKKDYSWVDKQDNFGRDNCVVYARNAVFDIAEKCGYKYFVVLDDDYTKLRYRFKRDNKLASRYCVDADELFRTMFELLESSDKITCVGLAQTGDYIGGLGSAILTGKTIRKIMNSWFCSTDKRFYFTGTINEDTTAYTTLGSRGKLFLTVQHAGVNQVDTQQTHGGLVDVYLDLGTYIKSFYSVMSCPSSVKIAMMGDKHYRMHHKIKWDNTVPKIVSGRYKKGDN